MSARPVKFPPVLRLGGKDWRLRRRKLPDALGLSDEATRTITVHPGQDRIEELDTVLHELFHSILRSQGREYDMVPEETYVRALATGLAGALNDNPDLLPYIKASLKQ